MNTKYTVQSIWIIRLWILQIALRTHLATLLLINKAIFR